MPHLLSPQSLSARSADIGPKARTLGLLLEKGFNVPPFLALSAGTVATLQGATQQTVLREIQDEVRSRLPAKRYAVRSAGLKEDLAGSSQAGRFVSALDVGIDALPEAIMTVITDAWSKGERQFSLFIQHYIPSDISGVTFTRSPLGGREMVVEWAAGRRGEVESGTVQPSRVAFYRTQREPKTGLPDLGYAVREWKRIEQLCRFPQDIEWCLWKKDWYVLQARPISTLTPMHEQENAFLDSLLPTKAFLYEKTEITEMAPRPTPVTLSVLRRLYGAGGPVEKAYASMGLRYTADDFLLLVGNELFIDRERELQTLLPSFSYLGKRGHHPSLRRLKGLRTTLRTIAATHKLDPAAQVDRLSTAMDTQLSEPLHGRTLTEVLEGFLQSYVTVAAINIGAARSLSQLERQMAGKGMNTATVLSASLVPGDEAQPVYTPPKGLLGNTLELSDTTPFFGALPVPSQNWEAQQWWNALPEADRDALTPLIRTAQTYNTLREKGRWLTVLLIHTLRDALYRRAAELGLARDEAYAATLDELLTGRISAEDCAKRREQRARFSHLHVPPRLTHLVPLTEPRAPLGVSAGLSTGVLATPETLAKAAGPVILAVRTLSPDLLRHFGRVGGILAEHGGMLSHLAIVARERKLPVIVNIKPGSEMRIGDVVEMNGGTGMIRVLKRM